jgi:hypothetical protein
LGSNWRGVVDRLFGTRILLVVLLGGCLVVGVLAGLLLLIREVSCLQIIKYLSFFTLHYMSVQRLARYQNNISLGMH